MRPRIQLAFVLLAFAVASAWPARATSFEEFGRLNTDDEAGFIAFLVEAAAQSLKAHGQPDKASQAIALFDDSSKAGGVQQLALNLQMLYRTNRQNATKASNSTPPYKIEDAMVLTLRAAGIVVPASYLEKAANDFRPTGVLRRHIYGP